MSNDYPTFICAQPACLYYAWQVEVMLHNFIDLGIHNEFDIHLVFAYNTKEPNWDKNIEYVQKVEKKFQGYADFFFYEDKRQYPISYISSIRPNILKQHYATFPNLAEETVFYHDCDIIFSKYPDFIEKYTDNDMNWYVSDTRSYIGAQYIIQKGVDVLTKMCDIVGIDQKTVVRNQSQSGGCQYIMKGVDWRFFDKVEKDCERMYKEISELNAEKIKADPTHHPLQIWTADMWCILWNAWMRGFKTNVVDELDFCWATDSIENYHKKYIFHNAGVVSATDGKFFFKGDFRAQVPYNNFDIEKIDKERATYKYAELIQNVAQITVLKYE